MVKSIEKIEIVGIIIFMILAFLVVGKYYIKTTDEYLLTLPASEKFSVPIEWRYDWGDYKIKDNSLSIISSNALLYRKSINYSDYDFQISFCEYNSDSISLIARLQDNSSYTSCVFDNKYFAIINRINGKENVVRKIMINNDKYLIKNGTSIGIMVNNDYIQCLIDKTPVIHFKNAQMLSHGGIGIKINSETQNNSKVSIDSMSLNFK